MTDPIWLKTAPKPKSRPALISDARADVCVVGAGFAGLLTALRLLRAGRRVVVVEQGAIGGGESLRTTAHLASYQDDGLLELERLHGADNARLAVAGHGAAIDEIERVVREEGLDCEFRRLYGWLIAQGKRESEELAQEAEACERAGLAFRRFEGPTGSRLNFPRQGALHPAKFLHGLADSVERLGGKIYARSRVERVEGGEHPSVHTARGAFVQAAALVIATNAPINDRVALSTRQGAYRTYVVALRVKAGSFFDALHWDMKEPYHYVRLARDGRGELLLVGGEDHRTGQTDEYFERFDRLEDWAREHYPAVGRVVARWSGQVQEPADGLGFYGRHPSEQGNVFVATGDSGQGVTGAALASLILSDLILGRVNRFAALFAPSRVTAMAAAEYVKENVKSVGQGYKGHIMPSELSSPSEIEPGEGAVLRRGLEKKAVYRRPDGTIVERSGICPHLGGMVCWNALEKTWDCPAHGSRFTPEGEPLCGPAGSPLAETERPAREDRPEDRPAA